MSEFWIYPSFKFFILGFWNLIFIFRIYLGFTPTDFRILDLNPRQSRSSHWGCSEKKGALKNFANFAGEQLCWSLFSIQWQAWKPTTLLKRDSNTCVFLWNLRSFFKNTYFEEHLWTTTSGKHKWEVYAVFVCL